MAALGRQNGDMGRADDATYSVREGQRGATQKTSEGGCRPVKVGGPTPVQDHKMLRDYAHNQRLIK